MEGSLQTLDQDEGNHRAAGKACPHAARLGRKLTAGPGPEATQPPDDGAFGAGTLG